MEEGRPATPEDSNGRSAPTGVLEVELDRALHEVHPRVQARIHEWARRLIDLSRRNRLLAYRPTKRTTIVFREPSAEAIAARLLEGKEWTIYQPPELDEDRSPLSLQECLDLRPARPTEIVADEPSSVQLSLSLEAIARRAKAEFDDRGIHTLHLIWGLLKWADPGADQKWAAPLVLIPVKLARRGRTGTFQLQRTEEDARLNPALRVKVQNDYGIALDDVDLEEVDLAGVRELVDTAMRGRLPQGWAIEDHAALGLFSFAKEPMYRDLVENAAEIAKHPGVQSLALGTQVEALRPQIEVDVPSEETLDSVQSPMECYSVLDADSSQRVAIEAAVRGQSFVLHGPPGTGKSQTIANIIAELIARGKTVLFVSEKAAALDVVANRLASVNLLDPVLELHSAKASRAEVATSIYKVLSEAADTSARQFDVEAAKFVGIRTRLNDYAAAMWEIRQPLGRSVHDVIAKIEQLHEAPALPAGPVDPGSATSDDLESIERLAAKLSDVWDPIEQGAEFYWRDCVYRTLSAEDRQRVIDTLEDADRVLVSLGQLEDRLAAALARPAPGSKADREALVALGELARAGRSAPEAWLTRADLSGMDEVVDRWDRTTTERAALASHLATAVGTNWLALSPDLATALERALAACPAPLREGVVGAEPAAVARAAEGAAAVARELGRVQHTTSLLRSKLGLRSRGDGLADVELLLRLARISQDSARPPRTWLSRARAGETEAYLREWGSIYRTVQEHRRYLLEHYREELLEADLEPLLGRMERQYGRWWNLLRPQHRRDRKTLAGFSRTGQLSSTALSDLRSAVELRRQEQLLRDNQELEGRMLGPYARGTQTDVAAANRALEAALFIIDLPHDSTDWSRLEESSTYEAPYDPEIERAADQLGRSIALIRAGLEPIAALADTDWVGRFEQTSLPDALAQVEELATHLDAIASGAGAGQWGHGVPSTVGELVELARTRRRIAELDQEIQDSEDQIRASLDTAWLGMHTDWSEVRESLRWARQVRRLYGGRPIDPTAARLLCSGEAGQFQWGEYEALVAAAEERVAAVVGFFRGPRAAEIGDVLNSSSGAASALLRGLHARVDQLATWVRYQELCAQLGERGWSSFVDASINRRSSRAELAPAARQAWLRSWVEQTVAGDARLAEFSLEDHERLVATFRDLDEALIRLAPWRVLECYEGRKPLNLVLASGELSLIRREGHKKRRHLPVRSLLSQIPTALPQLKPCLMMSPLTVSYFLPPDALFDVVIFDEASQVPPEDAVNCVYRGRQLIVAGDPNQLPPTDFFQKVLSVESDQEAESQVDDFESVLELALTCGYPERRLRWHYRSHHDSLIAFSNRFIYDNSLITFPPPHRDGDELGVRFVHVPDGVFDRGRTAKNLVEAQRVVDVLAQEIRAHPESTLGVVAFSAAQQQAIEDEWERRVRREPDLERATRGDRLRALFIKNLETVQGDERDTIIVSVGYGRDANGRLIKNFGPLNRERGWRRLNVAVTRARKKLVVVSSIRSDDFETAEAVPGAVERGAELLRAYLAYAERGTLPTTVGDDRSRGTFENAFEAEVAAAVRSLGYEVVPQVGVGTYRIDIGVVSRTLPSRYVLGIECDGVSYHSAKTARDRDRLREQVLRQLGWRIHRVWSQDWFERRDIALKRLRSVIEEAEQAVSDNQVVVGRLRRDGVSPDLGSIWSAATIQIGGARTSGSEAGQPGSDPQVGEARPSVRAQAPPTNRVARQAIDTARGELADLPWTVPYRVTEVDPYRPGAKSGVEFHQDWLVHQHVQRISSVVATEGPVHIDILARRLARAFGVQRVGSRIFEAVAWGVGVAEQSGAVVRRGPFVWPRALKELTHVRVPTEDPRTRRSVQEIPPEEVDLAILRLVEASAHIRADELRRVVARLFRFDRTGDIIAEYVDSRIRQLLTAGKLKRGNDGLSLAVRLPPVPAKAPTDGY